MSLSLELTVPLKIVSLVSAHAKGEPPEDFWLGGAVL
jgi:hypothetical protein